MYVWNLDGSSEPQPLYHPDYIPGIVTNDSIMFPRLRPTAILVNGKETAVEWINDREFLIQLEPGSNEVEFVYDNH